MPNRAQVAEALMAAIKNEVESGPSPGRSQSLLALAEAFAWTVFPNQPHGGSTPQG